MWKDCCYFGRNCEEHLPTLREDRSDYNFVQIIPQGITHHRQPLKVRNKKEIKGKKEREGEKEGSREGNRERGGKKSPPLVWKNIPSFQFGLEALVSEQSQSPGTRSILKIFQSEAYVFCWNSPKNCTPCC